MSDTIGKFFRNPASKPGKQSVPNLTLPTALSFQDPPTLSVSKDPLPQPSPTLSVPKLQPAQAVPFAETTPVSIPFQAPPKLTVVSPPSPLQPAPALVAPDVIPLQFAPTLTVPATVPFEPPPALTIPAVIPLEPPPALTIPAVIPLEPAPALTVPAVIPFEPAPALAVPATIPFEPAPDLSAPSVIPFEPAPKLSTPSVIQFEPAPELSAPAVIPFERAPPLTVPARIPRPPPNTPDPEFYQDRVLKNTNVIQVDALGFSAGVTYAGKIQAGFDPHIKLIAIETLNNAKAYAVQQAQALVQSQLSNAVRQAEEAVGGAVLSFFAPPAQPSLPDSIGEAVPGGSQIKTPSGDPSKQPRPHRAPTETKLADLQVQTKDDTSTYNSDSRERAQIRQETQALNLDSDVDKYNSWNDNFDYGSVQSDGQSRGLQRSFGASADGTNNQQALINGPLGSDAKGYFPFNGSEQSLPQDDDVYVPLVFTDLRPSPSTDSKTPIWRTVYFRPFIKNLSENFAPQWNLATYFGRGDAVATYKGTNRTISLGFKITCFSPEDLAANYRKLAWLTSMCYPEYENGMYFAGPVIRLRVGDVISSIGGVTGKGLSGVITSLDISYDDATWELTSGQKLPRDIDVSIGFQVLHDRAIGITKTNAGMQFGGYQNGTSDIRKFRAAFGSVDYINETVAAPKTAQVPAIIPLTSSPLQSAGDFTTTSNFTDGGQPNTEVNDFASSFPGSNADDGMGMA
jgi:hypothetical protein